MDDSTWQQLDTVNSKTAWDGKRSRKIYDCDILHDFRYSDTHDGVSLCSYNEQRTGVAMNGNI
jgi:hypothetical protein